MNSSLKDGHLPNLIIIFLFEVDFVIHWNETAMGLHVFPIPIPPPTSLSTRSLLQAQRPLELYTFKLYSWCKTQKLQQFQKTTGILAIIIFCYNHCSYNFENFYVLKD